MKDLVSPSTEPDTLAVRGLTIQSQKDSILFHHDLLHMPSYKLLSGVICLGAPALTLRLCTCIFPRFSEDLVLSTSHADHGLFAITDDRCFVPQNLAAPTLWYRARRKPSRIDKAAKKHCLAFTDGCMPSSTTSCV
jgi:hypothetical protein